MLKIRVDELNYKLVKQSIGILTIILDFKPYIKAHNNTNTDKKQAYRNT